MRFEPTITMKTAHDIRKLEVCGHCGTIGDRRHMPKVDGKLLHGFCALETLGEDGVLALPKDELGKISMGEIGPKAMKRIMERV